MAHNPASVKTDTPGINHFATVWYDTVAIENLKSHLPFVAATSRRKLPNRNGRTIQLFTYNVLAANTTPGSEGTVGTGINPTSETNQATVLQYFDFMNFSDLVLDTSIDPILENASAELGYRAALTANTLARSEFEVVGAKTGGTIDLADNEFLSAATIREAVMDLRSDDIRAVAAGGMFMGIIHPFAAFDLINDNTVGGVIDILKRDSGNESTLLQRGIQGFNVVDIAGVRFIETNTVATSADFPSSSKTGYHTYIVGQDAVISVSLGAMDVPDGERNFRLITQKHGPSLADPAGVIGASVAYNFKYVATGPPGTGAAAVRMRRIRSETSIT